MSKRTKNYEKGEEKKVGAAGLQTPLYLHDTVYCITKIIINFSGRAPHEILLHNLLHTLYQQYYQQYSMA